MATLPVSYGRLERWFPTQTGRAAALGVSREQVRLWERRVGDEPRPSVRARTAAVVDRVAAAAAQVEQLVGDAEAAGVWLLVPQPALRGESALGAVRGGRLGEVMPLLGTSVPGTRGRFSSDDVRTAAATLGEDRPVRRERPRDAEAAEVLRLLGEDELLIGPDADA